MAWLVGHAAVYAIVAPSTTGEPPVWVWALTGAAHLLPVVWIVGCSSGPAARRTIG